MTLSLDLILLIAKYVLLAALYGFVYIVFRTMFAQLRTAGEPQSASERRGAETDRIPVKTTADTTAAAHPPRRQSRSSPVLLVVASADPERLPPGTELPLDGERSLGRAPDNNVVLPDRFASQHHALILARGTQRILCDRGSTNGIYVNGRRTVADTTLHDGDHLVLGRSEFIYQAAGSNHSSTGSGT